jgi:plasmid stabilization system protein ParE
MTTLWFSRRALKDLERLVDFMLEHDEDSAERVFSLITNAVEILARHPEIGRPVEKPLRELVISRERTGYIALYAFDAKADQATIHAVRHQRESGYHP